jgi:hypothetical protein
VPLIEDLIETAAVEVAGARHRRLGSHGKTPDFSGSLPRNRHSTMLREDEESFSLNQLWVVQGRLLNYVRKGTVVRNSKDLPPLESGPVTAQLIPMPEIEIPEPSPRDRTTLFKLRAQQCRYVVSDDSSAAIFCGAPTHAGSSW